MTNIVLFRLTEDQSLWIADLEAGTVERAEALDTNVGAQDPQGIDLAIAASARSDAASHYMFPSRGPKTDGVDFAHVATARSDAASHYMYPSHEPRLEGVASAHAAKVRPGAASHFLYPSH